MDFKQFFATIRKNLKFILVLAAMVVLFVEAFFVYTGGGYDASLSLFVYSKVSQNTADYQYDGYYSVKAADEFGNTVSQWVASPEIVKAIYSQAGIALPQGLSSFYRVIKAQKMAPQYIDVRFNVAKEADADKIAMALANVFAAKAEQASKLSGSVVFSVVAGEPVVKKNQPNFLPNGILAFIGGFLLSILLVLLKEQPDYDHRR